MLLERIDSKIFMLIIVLIASVSILVTSYTFVYLSTVNIYSVTEFSMDLKVSTIIGFYVGDDAVHFGYVPPGGGGMKEMNIDVGKYKTLVSIDADGNISKWVTISDNDFIMEPNTNRTLRIFVNVPEDAPLETDYSGNITIVLRKAE